MARPRPPLNRSKARRKAIRLLARLRALYTVTAHPKLVRMLLSRDASEWRLLRYDVVWDEDKKSFTASKNGDDTVYIVSVTISVADNKQFCHLQTELVDKKDCI